MYENFSYEWVSRQERKGFRKVRQELNYLFHLAFEILLSINLLLDYCTISI